MTHTCYYLYRKENSVGVLSFVFCLVVTSVDESYFHISISVKKVFPREHGKWRRKLKENKPSEHLLRFGIETPTRERKRKFKVFCKAHFLSK